MASGTKNIENAHVTPGQSGDVTQDYSGGAAHVINSNSLPVTTVSRFAIHAHSSAVPAHMASVAVVGAADDLILWDTFGNTPFRARFRCTNVVQSSNAAPADHIRGWWVFVNTTQAQVRTELLRLCDTVGTPTGIANYAVGGTQHGNTDQKAIFVGDGDDFEYTHGTEITSCVVAATSRTLAAEGESLLSAYFMPNP